ncbi:hypothetical protein [Acaryochloris sp. IP29b_bin.148]|uniref:DUF7925 domain-containing protein n=1 Tax=Acaryochloris sp. IP29b_bin.148 TaxID=2969218 RepID=UPI00261E25F3|nr:hypothetical protein [Acaryochloris sp. IP29b_bin.148]
MTHDTPKSQRLPRKAGPLAIAALLAGGLLQPLLPAFAAGTPAGSNISNTATATYNDGNGTDIEATSNTVSIEVAEVAGLTVQPSGFNDLDGGAVQAGDVLEYDFQVTNVGNADTDISIPGVDDLNDPANSKTENFTVTAIEVYDSAGNLIGTINPGDDPQQLVADLGFDPDTDPLTAWPADDFITVRVIGTPAAGTRANDPVGVTLGDTGDNTGEGNSQNQPDDNDPINGDTTPLDIDLRTVNFGPETPVNGEREAAAGQSIPFASSETPVALAQVEKVASLAPGDTADADDDLITYGLSLTVEDTSPNAAFEPADLAGTSISVNDTTATHILVSDAIPEGTSLNAEPTGSGGWIPVYTSDDLTGVNATPALAADWYTDVADAGGVGAVTRIGFIFTANATLAPGTTSPALNFTVITDDLNPAGGQVANIAQAFGTTDGDPNAEIVYDESGDSNPNNFNDDGTPPAETGPNADPNPTGTNYDPNEDDGVADPSEDGTDIDGDNTGEGPKGEDNVVNIGISAGPDELSNGPNGDPAAIGPTDSNDDFTNLSTDVPAGLDDDDLIPAPGTNGAFLEPVLFSNTVQNPNTSGFIQDVTIEPISPTQAQDNDESALEGLYGENSDIPNGTRVTIDYDPDQDGDLDATDGDEQQAVYIYNGTIFELDPTVVGNAPVNVGQLDAGEIENYNVTVELPGGTVTPLDEIPIPIVAFPDDDPENDGDGTPGSPGTRGFIDETTNNITINRVYTGFMELVKQARILEADGFTEVEGWTSNITEDIEPGQFIEYRISYQNISSPEVGSGNVGLTAFDFRIIEDGNDATVNADGEPGNTWAALTTHQQNTAADRGTVDYFSTSDDLTNDDVLISSDPLDGTRVDAYRNNVGIVDPQESGQFQFRRVVD